MSPLLLPLSYRRISGAGTRTRTGTPKREILSLLCTTNFTIPAYHIRILYFIRLLGLRWVHPLYTLRVTALNWASQNTLIWIVKPVYLSCALLNRPKDVRWDPNPYHSSSIAAYLVLLLQSFSKGRFLFRCNKPY